MLPKSLKQSGRQTGLYRIVTLNIRFASRLAANVINIFLFRIGCLSLLLGTTQVNANTIEGLTAIGGVLDLRSWSTNSQPSINLSGEWTYYPGIGLDSSNFSERNTFPSMSIPYGSRKVNLADQNQFLGSYVLQIKNRPDIEVSLLFNQWQRGLRVILISASNPDIHREVFTSAGFKLQDRSKEYYSYREHLTNISRIGSDFYIIVQTIASANVTLELPTLGTSDYLESQRQARQMQIWFTLGSFFLLGLYNFSIFLQRREDKGSLYISLLTAAMFIRYFSTEALWYLVFDMDSRSGYNFHSFILVFVYPLGNFCLIKSLQYSFEGFRSRSITFIGKALPFAMAIICMPLLFSPFTIDVNDQYFSNTFIGFNIVSLPLIVYVFWSGTYRSIQLREPYLQYFILGLSILLATFVSDYLVTTNLYSFPYLGQNGMMFFAFMQSITNGKRFSLAFRTAERLSKDLQSEVERQTEKLRLQKEKLEDQQKSLSKVHDDLKENDEQKTRFFRSISHELRTPLTMILGTLQESENPDNLKRSVSIASKHAKRLYRLVNQLLDFQKVALSKVKLRLERVDLATFVPGICEYVEMNCRNQGISFSYEVDSSIQGGWLIRAQIDALEKILFNYIGNALKFTPKGGAIRLRLDLQGHYARITVTDTGCGIPKEQQSKLFKLFSQIEGPQQVAKQGTGLGLALVKELASQMEGRIGVDSEAGRGSSFWVEFPRQVAEADQYAILLVDSNVAAQEAMQRELSRVHLDTHFCCVSSSKEARKILQQWPVQVLLVNTNLGEEASLLLDQTAETHPSAWRVMIADSQHRSGIKTISAQSVQALFAWPLDPEFFLQIQTRLYLNRDQTAAPVLDLVYVDDEASMRDAFFQAIQRYSLIERYRIVDSAQGFQELLGHYRIKTVVIDANLEEAGSGIQLLAQTARLSPDTYRILFTGDSTGEMLAAAIREGHAQYIMYKPANFEKEFKVIEDHIAQSMLEPAEITKSGESDVIHRDWQLAGALSAGQDDAPVQEEDEANPNSPGTILVVDDLSDMRNILHDILHKEGYRILHAESGRHALERIHSRRESIDLIITDWMMPEMTGPQLIHELHKFEEFSTIPTILLTAKSDEGSRSEGMKVGASAYIGKPFDHLELISVTENLLDLKRREKKISELNRFINENVLQRFLPPALVKDLVSGKAVFDDAAKMHSITVLFADLVDFTSSTEKLGPTRIARILNSFLVRMTDVIFSEGGTIDKFIGDAILVFFGAPTSTPAADQIEKATRCAQRMQEALEELNLEWANTEKHAFKMRIGIHHGPAIVGSFGGQKRSDYTAIGHTVNLASRIEGKAQPGEILMTASVRDFIAEDSWEYAGTFKMKGVESEMALYRLRPISIKSAA